MKNAEPIGLSLLHYVIRLSAIAVGTFYCLGATSHGFYTVVRSIPLVRDYDADLLVISTLLLPIMVLIELCWVLVVGLKMRGVIIDAMFAFGWFLSFWISLFY